jgi:hypothetical protein
LQDRLPFRGIRELERDPAVEINLLKRRERRGALGPPRIRQVLLRRIRDRACSEEEDQRDEEQPTATVNHPGAG